MESQNTQEGDWSATLVADWDLHGCKLIIDGKETNLSSIRVNTPKVNHWATHYSVRSDYVEVNKKIEFGQNMDSSIFDRTIARPETIRLNCSEGYIEWRAV